MSKNLTDIFPPSTGGGTGGGVEEAPKTGKMYARQDETWAEFATGNLEPGNGNDDVLLWDTAQDEWMPSKYVPSAFASSSTPASPKQGMLWLNTSNNVMYVYNRNSWEEVVDQDGFVKTVNAKAPNSSGAVTLTHTDVGAEKAFTKNTAFNKAFGTASGQVAQGNHTHTEYIKTGQETDPTVPAHVKSISQADINKWNSSGGGSETLQSVTSRGATTNQNIQCPNLFTSTDGYTLGGTAAGGNRLVLSGGFYFYNKANAPAMSCTEAGSVSAGDFIASSDERLKDNITTAPVGLIDGLKGREWEWQESGEKGSGVVAQELEKVLPHLVHTDDDGMKSVSYMGLCAYLIEEVKALKAEVESLK